MPLKTRPFDAAHYLETDEDIRLFLADAKAAGEKEFIHALETAIRAKGMILFEKETGISKEKLANPDSFTAEISHALGCV